MTFSGLKFLGVLIAIVISFISGGIWSSLSVLMYLPKLDYTFRRFCLVPIFFLQSPSANYFA